MKTYSTTINTAFVPLLTNHDRILCLVGGSGSGKSEFVAQKFIIRIIRAMKYGYQEGIMALRKTQPAVRRSVYALFGNLIKAFGLSDHVTPNKSELSYTFTGGSQIMCMGVDDPEKLKSIVNVTSIWMEETTEFHYQDYVQVDLRLRGDTPSYKQIVLTFNPRDTNRWVQDEFFDGDDPKPELKNTTVMRTTWRDNMFIDEEYTQRLAGLKDKDKTLWEIYDQGLWGILEHIIYSNYEIIRADEWPEVFDEVIYGLDWGTNSPFALAEVGILDEELYVQELIYEPISTPLHIIPKLQELEINRNKDIFADPVRLDLINMVADAGYNIRGANNSVLAGIDFVKTKRPKINSGSDNLIEELKTYKYKQNKAGDVLEEPVKAFDHLMDAVRYALYTYFNQEGKPRIWV